MKWLWVQQGVKQGIQTALMFTNKAAPRFPIKWTETNQNKNSSQNLKLKEWAESKIRAMGSEISTGTHLVFHLNLNLNPRCWASLSLDLQGTKYFVCSCTSVYKSTCFIDKYDKNVTLKEIKTNPAQFHVISHIL